MHKEVCVAHVDVQLDLVGLVWMASPSLMLKFQNFESLQDVSANEFQLQVRRISVPETYYHAKCSQKRRRHAA